MPLPLMTRTIVPSVPLLLPRICPLKVVDPPVGLSVSTDVAATTLLTMLPLLPTP